MKKNYRIRKTLSIKRLISELGQDFSEHIKERLLDLEVRCVLTRKDSQYLFDIKHVEHTKYPCDEDSNKEYTYGKFIVIDKDLYFSNNCIEDETVMRSSIVDKIYNDLDTEIVTLDENICSKKITDSNIDFIIDSILSVCPDVSTRYREIMKDVLTRAERKTNSVPYYKKR